MFVATPTAIPVAPLTKRFGKRPDGGRSAVGRVLYYLTPRISLFNRQYLTATAARCNLRAGTIPIKNTCHV